MENKNIVGLDEEIIIHGNNGQNIKVLARIDTGACKNSMDTNLAAELQLGPIVETNLIKSANGISVRPVIKATITIEGKKMETLFTLADRNHMKYKALIGQNTLKQGFIIDPNK